MNYDIIALDRAVWKDHILPIGYTTDRYFDVAIERKNNEFTVTLREKIADPPITHTPEEYDYPDRLYEEHWKDAYAWGIVQDGRLAAAIETCPEAWGNRLRITELWVDEPLRHRGVGHALIEIAKEQARLERRRALILETQSCNYNAIGFYLHEGFSLIGFDSCCYANNDLSRHEVRLELGILYDKPAKLSREDVEIRSELPPDFDETEQMVRRAFWNKYKPGCDEHLLVKNLRADAAYVPELSRVAVCDGRIVGCIMYSRSHVGEHETLTFGPLCVEPEYQGRRIGGMLLAETIGAAKEAGYSGIIIFGEPDYYPRFGFKNCAEFGITTAQGKNFDSFMALPLNARFADIHGKFHEAEVFDDMSGLEGYDAQFPVLRKLKFPKQL